jgi:hypothetical protein
MDTSKPTITGSVPLRIGAHIATPRGAYVHHGIYVGDGRVVHYGGLARGLRRGPVEMVTVEEFTQGRALRLITETSPCFTGSEVAGRALSRIGEDRYRVLTNNCEHFCEWCVRAEPRSRQVDAWLTAPRRVLKAANEPIGKLRELFRAAAGLRAPRVAPGSAN